MLAHPFTESILSKATGSILIVVAIVIQWGLLVGYAGAMPWEALADSFLNTALLAIAGYMAWYVLSFVRVWQVQILLTFLVQFVCLGMSFMLLTLIGVMDTEVFIRVLPLRFLFGILSWVVLLQWYWMLQKTDRMEIELAEKTLEAEAAATGATGRTELIDRISVKDGARIHIVHLEELYCLQASGDYVMLCTPTGQYIKEQTMKYFETSLPPSFVRIHRSVIVNTEFIQRVELFGKETYQVRLKNGQSLRASNTGYKLLKERLAL